MAIQVSESMLTLGSSRIRNGKPADDQQRQMNDLMIQTQKAISHRKDADTEMKQQKRPLNSQIVGVGKWREDLEGEILKSRGSQQVVSEKAATVHIASESYLRKLKTSWLIWKNETGVAPELVMAGKLNFSAARKLNRNLIGLASHVPGKRTISKSRKAYSPERHDPAREERAPRSKIQK